MPQPGQAILSESVITAREVAGELERLVREHSRLVYRIAYAVSRNHHDAEDATQEVFLRVLKHGEERLLAIEDRKLWVARIAWRVAVAKHKNTTPALSDSEHDCALARLRDANPGAEEIVISDEMNMLMERMVKALPRELRDVVTLSALKELSSAEVAKVLRIPDGTVRQRMFRARQMLKEKFLALTSTEGKRS